MGPAPRQVSLQNPRSMETATLHSKRRPHFAYSSAASVLALVIVTEVVETAEGDRSPPLPMEIVVERWVAWLLLFGLARIRKAALLASVRSVPSAVDHGSRILHLSDAAVLRGRVLEVDVVYSHQLELAVDSVSDPPEP